MPTRARAALISGGAGHYRVSTDIRIAAVPTDGGFVITMRDSEFSPVAEVVAQSASPYSWRDFVTLLISARPYVVEDVDELDWWTASGVKGLRADALRHALAADAIATLLSAQSDRSIRALERDLPSGWEGFVDIADELLDAVRELGLSGDYLSMAKGLQSSRRALPLDHVVVRTICDARRSVRARKRARESRIDAFRGEIDRAIADWRTANPPYSSNSAMGRGMQLHGLVKLIEDHVLSQGALPSGQAVFRWGRWPPNASDPGNNSTTVVFGSGPFSVRRLL